METMTEKQRLSITNNFKPIHVTPDVETHSFKVTGTLFYGGGLIVSTIHVTSDGKLSFHDQNLLLSGIHFPDSATYAAHAWAEA
jgi:hypothetical protein